MPRRNSLRGGNGESGFGAGAADPGLHTTASDHGLRDGRPAAGVTVEVYQPLQHPTAAHYQDKVGRSLKTNMKGEVVLPELPQAQVEVIAYWRSGSIATSDLEANLAIRYFPEDPQAEGHFTMDLLPYPNEQQYLEQTARSAEVKPIAKRVEQFKGTVVDPIGAPIQHVSIEVAELHVTGARPVRKLRSDAEGRFHAPLRAGDYVAIFSCSGFQQRVEGLTIEKSAAERDMRIVLQVGAMSE